jgi:site-specific DNA recombinase
MKRAIIYIRKSTDRQSNWSIDGQREAIQRHCARQGIEITDEFVDDGVSARTFDRPDFKRLEQFIDKNYRSVDYLVVFAFDRFSRDSGDGLVLIKKLQRKYAIKITSVAEGITFDADDPVSFFYAGLMLLKAEDEIIRNRVRINTGIYTAKVIQGRYLGAAPYGYKNVRDENRRPLIVPNENTRHVVQYIFNQYIQQTPIVEISREAKKMGFHHTGKMAIQKILKNPVYIGLIHARAYQDHPDQWVEGIHEKLIDKVTFYQVQQRFKKPVMHHRIINDDFPLRGVLKCHCGLPLTGAKSTGKSGRKFPYYNCKIKGHNTIPAGKAHQQLEEVIKGLSLPKETIMNIESIGRNMLKERLENNQGLYDKNKKEYDEVDAKLKSIEEKYISNQMNYETYQRWFTELTKNRRALGARLEAFTGKSEDIYQQFNNEINQLNDLSQIYQKATTVNKQELLRLVFGQTLYYQDQAYRTPYLMKIFKTNQLNTKEKHLIFTKEKGASSSEAPSRGAEGTN